MSLEQKIAAHLAYLRQWDAAYAAHARRFYADLLRPFLRGVV